MTLCHISSSYEVYFVPEKQQKNKDRESATKAWSKQTHKGIYFKCY